MRALLLFFLSAAACPAVVTVTVVNAHTVPIEARVETPAQGFLPEAIPPGGSRIFELSYVPGQMTTGVIARLLPDGQDVGYYAQLSLDGVDYRAAFAPTSSGPQWQFNAGEHGRGSVTAACVWAFCAGMAAGAGLFIWQLTRQAFHESLL